MTQPRQPAGVPGGGRFTPGTRARAVVELYDPRAQLRNPHVDRFAAGPLTTDEEEQLTQMGAEVTDEVRVAAERYFGGDTEAIIGLRTPALVGIVKLDTHRRYALLGGTVDDPLLRARFALEAPLTSEEATQLEAAGWDNQAAAEEALLRYLTTGSVPEGTSPSRTAAVEAVARQRKARLDQTDPAAELAYSKLADQHVIRIEPATTPASAGPPPQPPRRLRDRLSRRGRG